MAPESSLALIVLLEATGFGKVKECIFWIVFIKIVIHLLFNPVPPHRQRQFLLFPFILFLNVAVLSCPWEG